MIFININLHDICNLIEDKIKSIIQYYLLKNEKKIKSIIYTIKKLYNKYFFSNSNYNKSNSQPPFLYNLHLVFNYIFKFNSNGFVTKYKSQRIYCYSSNS